MSPRQPFQIDGVVPIIPSPFHSDESIDFAGFAPLVDFAVAGRCNAICLPAYASEYYKLSDDERIEVVRQAVLRTCQDRSAANGARVSYLLPHAPGHTVAYADGLARGGIAGHRPCATAGHPPSCNSRCLRISCRAIIHHL